MYPPSLKREDDREHAWLCHTPCEVIGASRWNRCVTSSRGLAYTPSDDFGEDGPDQCDGCQEPMKFRGFIVTGHCPAFFAETCR